MENRGKKRYARFLKQLKQTVKITTQLIARYQEQFLVTFGF